MQSKIGYWREFSIFCPLKAGARPIFAIFFLPVLSRAVSADRKRLKVLILNGMYISDERGVSQIRLRYSPFGLKVVPQCRKSALISD